MALFEVQLTMSASIIVEAGDEYEAEQKAMRAVPSEMEILATEVLPYDPPHNDNVKQR